MNNLLNNPIIQGIVASLFASIIWWVFSKYLPFVKNLKAGNKSQLLFSLAIILFFTPIFSFIALYITGKPPSLLLLLYTSILLTLSFIVGILAFNIFTKEKDLYSFIKATKKKKLDKTLDASLIDCICTMRKAFHEIELEFNKHFERAQCTDPKKKDKIHIPGGPIPLKLTTSLEFDIYQIYYKYISKTVYNDNIISDIYGKEKVKTKQDDVEINYRWVLDPIDGGFHFVRNIPLFTTCVSLQKQEENGTWITHFSAIYIPLTKELFFAVKGKGAYLNTWDCRLPLERNMDLSTSIFYFEFPNKTMFDLDNINNLGGKGKYVAACNLLQEIFPKVGKVRGFNLGSFGLAYVAKGSFDAYISLSGSTSYYDSAAGILLVEESDRKNKAGYKGLVINELIDSKINEIDQGARIFATSEGLYSEIFKDKKLIDHLGNLFPHMKPLKKK